MKFSLFPEPRHVEISAPIIEGETQNPTERFFSSFPYIKALKDKGKLTDAQISELQAIEKKFFFTIGRDKKKWETALRNNKAALQILKDTRAYVKKILHSNTETDVECAADAILLVMYEYRLDEIQLDFASVCTDSWVQGYVPLIRIASFIDDNVKLNPLDGRACDAAELQRKNNCKLALFIKILKQPGILNSKKKWNDLVALEVELGINATTTSAQITATSAVSSEENEFRNFFPYAAYHVKNMNISIIVHQKFFNSLSYNKGMSNHRSLEPHYELIKNQLFNWDLMEEATELVKRHLPHLPQLSQLSQLSRLSQLYKDHLQIENIDQNIEKFIIDALFVMIQEYDLLPLLEQPKNMRELIGACMVLIKTCKDIRKYVLPLFSGVNYLFSMTLDENAVIDKLSMQIFHYEKSSYFIPRVLTNGFVAQIMEEEKTPRERLALLEGLPILSSDQETKIMTFFTRFPFLKNLSRTYTEAVSYEQLSSLFLSRGVTTLNLSDLDKKWLMKLFDISDTFSLPATASLDLMILLAHRYQAQQVLSQISVSNAKECEQVCQKMLCAARKTEEKSSSSMLTTTSYENEARKKLFVSFFNAVNTVTVVSSSTQDPSVSTALTSDASSSKSTEPSPAEILPPVTNVQDNAFGSAISVETACAFIATGMDNSGSVSVLNTLQAKQAILLKLLSEYEMKTLLDAREQAEIAEIAQDPELQAYYAMTKAILGRVLMAAVVITSGKVMCEGSAGVKAVNVLSTLSLAASVTTFPLAAPILSFIKFISNTLDSTVTYREMQQHLRWVDLEEIPQFAIILARRLTLAQKHQIKAGLSRTDETIWTRIKNQSGLFIEQLKSGELFTPAEQRALLDAKLLFEYMLTHDRPADMNFSDRINVLLQHLVGTQSASVSLTNTSHMQVNLLEDLETIRKDIASGKELTREQKKRIDELQENVRLLQEIQRGRVDKTQNVEVGGGQVQMVRQSLVDQATPAETLAIYRRFIAQEDTIAYLGETVAVISEQLAALECRTQIIPANNIKAGVSDDGLISCCIM